MFGGDYHRAIKAFRRISLKRKKARRAQMGRLLRAVAEHVQPLVAVADLADIKPIP